MSAYMTLRERVRSALKGEMPDQVPFTSYPGFAPDGEPRRRLCDLGLAAFERVRPFQIHRPNVTAEREEISGQKYPTILTRLRTPLGELTQKDVIEPGYGSAWIKEYLVKRPEDYAVLEFILRDEVIEPDIDHFIARDEFRSSFTYLGRKTRC